MSFSTLDVTPTSTTRLHQEKKAIPGQDSELQTAGHWQVITNCLTSEQGRDSHVNHIF